MKILERYLDPSETLLGLLFGLIMALTITAGARLLSERADIVGLELALALLGCNVAWGVIDGAFYLLGTVFNRNRRVQFVKKLQVASTDAEAMADEFGLEDEPPLRPQDRADLYRSLRELFRHAGTPRAHLRADDWAAAALIAVLVSATAIPGMIPLLLFQDGMVALRVANAIQIVLLFVTGYWWARYSGGNRWLVGLAIAVLGARRSSCWRCRSAARAISGRIEPQAVRPPGNAAGYAFLL